LQKAEKFRLLGLFCFFVRHMLTAVTAIFFQFQPIFQEFFIFSAEIIGAFALSTFQLNHIFSFFGCHMFIFQIIICTNGYNSFVC